uniref:Acyltransferase 3 domain-containing protein n=1 Tax=Arion vulgaris TaxID=1028688 RepID=A0A0B6ZGH0_9EUPU
MKWYVALLGWALAAAAGLAVVYGLNEDIGGEKLSDLGLRAFYNAVARSAWGACVCWVIIACASGRGGFVNTILSWSPFVVLGRFTYMAYLVHPALIYAYFQNQEQLFYVTDTSVVVSYCGLVVVVNMFAFVLMLALESPWIGLERVFIHKKGKE